MCTLTYLPTKKGETIVTSNRDESPARPTSSELIFKTHQKLKILLPVDELAGGTWISGSENGQIHCLLNGAFEKHKFNPPYKISRGLVLLESFHYNSMEEFKSAYDFDGIQPFTLVAFNSNLNQLEELRFTGDEVVFKSLNQTEPRIWSAAQLYDLETIQYRKRLFHEFLKNNPSPSGKDLINFHKQEHLTDPNKSLIINRNGKVKTVSITQAHTYYSELKMRYEDLESGNTDNKCLILLND